MKRILLSFITILIANAVMAQCNPSFTFTLAPTGNNLLNVNFTNTTSFVNTASSYAYYNLYYGDGNQGSATSSHNYAAPGTYTAKLKMYVLDSVTQALICSDSVIHLVTVAYLPCATSFSQTVGSGGSVTFVATNPANTPGMTYSWNFGDGNTGSGSPVTHVYAANGVYNVTLTATSTSASCTYTNSHTVPVTNIVPTGCTGHTASFSKSTSAYTVYVNNTSPGFSGQTRTASWTFGDGGTGTGNSTNHTYTATGTYTIVMTCTWTDSATNTVACTNTNTQTVTITGGTTGPNVIQGHIAVDSVVYNGVDSFKVWLITYNSSTSMLAAVDSTFASGYGGANYYFQGEPSGTYLTKAKFLNTANSPIGYLPTYHNSSVYWSGATNIVHTGGYNINNNIIMIQGIPTSGPGFVGGNVNMGANKGTGAGVPNMEIILRDANNNPIQYTYTNSNGDYSFSNVPLGTYSIYPEEMNYLSTPFTGVTLTSSAPSATGFIFGVTNDHIQPKTTAVPNAPVEGQFAIYPNPSNGKVSISWAKTPADYNVTVTDIAGHVVFKANNQAEMNLSQLQTGMYFIKVSTGNMNATEKLMIQH